MYPELWLHEFARERQREMREFAAGWAGRGIGEESSAKRLASSFWRRLTAGKSLVAGESEGGGKLGTRSDLEHPLTASHVIRDHVAGDEPSLRELAP
jgi:hypothetical protein